MNPELPEDPIPSPGEGDAASNNPLDSHVAPEGLDYEVLRLIGRGGYGEVWLVRDKTGGYLACKVIYRESFDHDRPYEREYDGIKKFEPVSRIDPSQVKILHVGRRDHAGYFYYIMELADDASTGREIDPERYIPKTLRTELSRQGRLPLNECLQIGLSLSAAVEHLHGNGLIHRDIKPGNVIFVNGLPKLADIGLVTDVDLSISYVGTEGYIPPEGPTSAQADVYGLGKVLYEISTGKDRLDFPDLPTELGELPDRQARLEFNAVVARACEAKPVARYQTAGDLHADLALLQSGGSVRRKRSRKARLLRIARAGLVAALLFALGAAVVYLRRPQSAVPGAADSPDKVTTRIAAPPPEQVARSEKEIRQGLKSSLADASTAVKRRLAEQLIQESATTSDPARELASFRVAADLAAQAESYPLAMAACDKMASRFIVSPVAYKAELLEHNQSVSTPEGFASLANAAVATGFDALGIDDYESARRMAVLAKTISEKSGNPHLKYEAEFLEAEGSRCGTAYGQTAAFRDTLRKNPADPAANLAIGQFLCFAKNDWEKGLPMMAHGNDEQLKPVLEMEINKKPARVPDLIAAGDLWWSLAAANTNDLKAAYQRRARYWYRIGVSRAHGPEKESVKQQVGSRLAVVPPVAAELRIFCHLSGTDHISVTSDEIRWSTARASQNCQVNYLQIDPMKRTSERVIKNSGATRLLPDDVDFSTAQLTIKQSPKQHARANLEKGMDHVRVNLAHSGNGMPAFEVIVTFGEPPEN